MFKNIQAQVAFQFVLILLLIAYIGWRELRANRPDSTPPVTSIAEPTGNPIPPTELPDAPPVPSYQAMIIPTPTEVTFAGETVSLQDPDLRERLDRELHVNANWHSNTILLIKKAHRWLPLISEILAENNVPDDFKYLPVIESGLVESARSPKDAIGFWQLLKGTAKDYDLEVNKEVDERYDPVKSTEAACKYLKKAYAKFGSWADVAASYNIGIRGLERRLEAQNVDSYFDMLLNEETARYFFRVVSIKMIIENPEGYGFHVAEDQRYVQPEFDTVTVTKSIKDLVAFAQKHGISYKILKRHNPWLRTPKLTVRRKTYHILISKDPAEQYKAMGRPRVTS
jgi:hypothetical protein